MKTYNIKAKTLQENETHAQIELSGMDNISSAYVILNKRTGDIQDVQWDHRKWSDINWKTFSTLTFYEYVKEERYEIYDSLDNLFWDFMLENFYDADSVFEHNQGETYGFLMDCWVQDKFISIPGAPYAQYMVRHMFAIAHKEYTSLYKYKPYADADLMHIDMDIKLIHMATNKMFTILEITKTPNYLLEILISNVDTEEHSNITINTLFNNFMWADGSICGIKA